MRKKGSNLIEIKHAYFLQNQGYSPKDLIKKILITGNISLIICTILIVLWQIWFSIIFILRNNKQKSSKFYKQVISDIDDFIIITSVKIIDYTDVNTDYFNEKYSFNATEFKYTECTKYNYQPFRLLSFNEIMYTCLDNTTSSGKTELSFDSQCDKNLALDRAYEIDSYNKKRFCYQSYSKDSFKYRFVLRETDCDDDELYCGINSKYKICLLKSKKITQCPITNLLFLDSIEEYKANSYFSEHSYLVNITKLYSYKQSNKDIYRIAEKEEVNSDRYFNVMALNYSMENYQFLTVGLSYEPSTFKEYNTTAVLESTNSEIFDSYFSYLNSNTQQSNEFNINVNSADTYYSLIESGLEEYTESGDFFVGNITSFFSSSFNDNYSFANIDPTLTATFGKSAVYFPTENCIEKVFIAQNKNTDYLKSLSNLHMEFLDILIPFYIVWTIGQLILNLIFTFMYKVKVLMKTINGKLNETDKHYEIITTVTIKSFYYFCLIMRIIVVFQIRNIFTNKIDFLNSLVENKCYMNSITNKYTLFMIKLICLSQDVTLSQLNTAINMIITIIYIELFLEAGNIGFMFLDKYLNKLLGIY